MVGSPAGAIGKSVTLALALIVSAVGCRTTADIVLERPAGFAVYQGEGPWQAVSPEGVVMQVRLLENDPPQGLSFWAEALEIHLVKTGYRLTGKESVTTPAGEAVVLDWLAPVAGEDWVYLTAFLVHEDRIALVEAAGPYGLFQRHRAELMASIATLAVPEP